MRLGPILQVLVAVPALAPAVVEAESALGLSMTAQGRFPREVALTLGATALVEAPCLTLGREAAPFLLLLVEDAGRMTMSDDAPGWVGIGLDRSGPGAVVDAFGLRWTLSDGPPALVEAIVASTRPAITRGYYRGLGAASPASASPWRLPLRDGGQLRIEAPRAEPSSQAQPPAFGRALVLGRGSADAARSAPDAHAVGPDGEWLLLRAAPIRPLTV